MALPVTNRGSEQVSYLPSTSDISKAVEVATTPEASVHLVHMFKKRMDAADKGMQAASQGMLRNLEINSELKAANELNSDGPWLSGKAPEATANLDAENKALSQGLKQEMSTNNLDGVEVDVDFAISRSEGELKRAFSINHDPLEESSEAILNDLFINYLEENNYSLVVTDEGSFLRDKNGKPIKGDQVDEARALIMDPETGFKASLQQHRIKTTVRAHPFPGEQPLALPAEREPTERPATPGDESLTIE